MKKHIIYTSPFYLIIIILVCFLVSCTNNENNGHNFVKINPSDSYAKIIKKAANVTPSPRQYNWQKLEMTGFIHFGINTFDRVEWGKKNIDISKFNPKKIDVRQWVKVFKDAGIKLIILTTKHHDGFCLWPSKYTKLNISQTPFKNGKGDIVRDLSNACHEANIKFGVYLSPWDMHEKTYGTPQYNEHFLDQLRELLTNYGEISEVWFDGANGEGPNGKKQIYDWQAYYKLIRKLQPKAVIAVMGPDVRWVGTESGYGRETEWSVIPGSNMNVKEVAKNSQQENIDKAFIPKNLMDSDLGGRDKIFHASSLVWYPAEIDVSIRPRWFYHSEDDELVKSPEKLIDIYYNSVGLNGVLLLNIPPDTDGLINKNDIRNLKDMKYILDRTFKNNLACNANAQSSSSKNGFGAKNILDDNLQTFWTTNDTTNTATIEIKLEEEKTFNRALLQENILVGQRIEKFHLDFWNGNKWETFANATTIGYRRLLRFDRIRTNRMKIVIDKCRTNPTIASFGLYLAPPKIKLVSGSTSFEKTTNCSIICDDPNAKIYYSTDNRIPDANSTLYTNKIQINENTNLTAIAISQDNTKSIPYSISFHKAKYKINLLTNVSSKYSGSGSPTLADGIYGSTNFNDGKWLGFNGNDMDAIIDLGKIKNVKEISSAFLSDQNSFIFLPSTIEYYKSYDGKIFKFLTELNNGINEKDTHAFIHKFNYNSGIIKTRFIKIIAKNISICPSWHKGNGEKAWLFASEITIK